MYKKSRLESGENLIHFSASPEDTQKTIINNKTKKQTKKAV